MTGDELSWAHTRAEWDQAWEHSRHLETMRGQYLGFFFTAALGVTAIVGPKLNVDSERSLAVVAALALLLEVLSATLYVAVVRLNAVYHWYQQIILTIRDETLSSPPAAVDLSAYPHAPRPTEHGPRRAVGLATTSAMSWLVLLLGIVGFAGALVGIMIRVATMSHPSTPAVLVSAIALLCGVLVAGGVLWILPPPIPSSQPRTTEPEAEVP